MIFTCCQNIYAIQMSVNVNISVLNDSCTADAECADLTDALCDTSSSTKACKTRRSFFTACNWA